LLLPQARHKAALLLRDHPVMCTGWRYHCACPKCQVGGGLVDRYVNALKNDNQLEADHLRGEIRRQQTQLAKKREA